MTSELSAEIHYYPPGKHPEGRIFRNDRSDHLLALECPWAYLGTLRFSLLSNPRPHCYLELLYIPEPYRQSGFATRLLKSSNGYLQSNNLFGLLLNQISDSHPARKIYERNGWEPMPDYPGWYNFNTTVCPNVRLLQKAIKKLRGS